MLCSTCSKRTSCKELCEEVELELRKNCNGKSTYKNKETSLCDMRIDDYCFERYSRIGNNEERNGNIKNTRISHYVWMEIRDIIETRLTHKQKIYTVLFLEGNTSEAIGRMFGIKGRGILYAIFGHPIQGGGVVKKIQTNLGIVNK